MKAKIKNLVDGIFKKLGYISTGRLHGLSLIVKEDTFKLEKVQACTWINNAQLRECRDIDGYEEFIRKNLRKEIAERLEPFLTLREENIVDRDIDRDVREYKYILYVATKINK